MNDLEFREQYKRLKEVHPYRYESPEKMKTVWNFVQDMDVEWFKTLVDRVVMSSKGDLDIGEALAAEKRARSSKQFADEVIEATKNWQQVTEQGLGRVLEKYGASNLLEAVQKSRRGQL